MMQMIMTGVKATTNAYGAKMQLHLVLTQDKEGTFSQKLQEKKIKMQLHDD